MARRYRRGKLICGVHAIPSRYGTWLRHHVGTPPRLVEHRFELQCATLFERQVMQGKLQHTSSTNVSLQLRCQRPYNGMLNETGALISLSTSPILP